MSVEACKNVTPSISFYNKILVSKYFTEKNRVTTSKKNIKGVTILNAFIVLISFIVYYLLANIRNINNHMITKLVGIYHFLVTDK